MRYKVMSKVEPGDILGRTLIDDKGSILLKAGAELKPNIFSKILEFNYGGLYIEDEISRDIEIDDLIPFELKLRAFKALKSDDYDLCVSIAKEFVQELIFKESLAINIIDVKNENDYTINHSIQVCIDSIILGIAYGLNETELNNLAIAAMLADIGKKDLPAEMLHKKERYNAKELEIMKEHPKIAFEKLKSYPNISPISRNSILFSHENLDGTGYYGKTEDQIHICSKIIRITDTFDSLTSKRKYREAFSIKESIELLLGSGSKLDMHLLGLMRKYFPVYPIGLTVRLSNGEHAVVVTNEHNSIRPIVRIVERDMLVDLSDDIAYRNVVINDIDR